MNQRHCLGIGAIVVIVSVLAPHSGSGQTHDPAAARRLNGHTFILSTQIDDPIITTLIRTQTGGGFATKVTRDIENEVVDSLINALVGELAFMALEFEYQHAVTHRLALSASASGAARIGIGAAGGVGGAYAPKPWLGFIFAGNLGYADTFSEEGRSDLAWDARGSTSFHIPFDVFPWDSC